MSDLVERLKKGTEHEVWVMVDEVVDEIERLEALVLVRDQELYDSIEDTYKANKKVERLEGALREIANKRPVSEEWGNQGVDADKMMSIAFLALDSKE